MAYEVPTYRGDKEFSMDCTGDACVGDIVKFERAVFSGSFRSPKFSHFELVQGEIIRDSYGAKSQQHTFTLKNKESIFRIKGRNLYRNKVYRKKWNDESLRKVNLEEKHVRGEQARLERQMRQNF